jgi:hypothetical protein
MAGAAPQHRAGSNATTIGMVVAIAVAVVLLGVLILLFTGQEQLRENADRARRAQERLASSADEDVAKQSFPEANAPGKTLIGEMNAGVKVLCGRMTGNENAAPKTVVKEMESTLAEIADKVPEADRVSSAHGAVTIIRNLFDMFKNEQDGREKAETALAKANDDLDTVRKANDDLNKTFKGDLAKLAAKVEELQKSKDEFERVKGDEVKSLAATIGAKQDLLDSMRRDRMKLQEKARGEIAKRDKSIEEQSRVLADLRAPGTAQAADPLAIARQPIGKILRALPGDALVHINLGRQDNVTLGMTFSVYSINERVTAEGHGKATVEVASVGERTAECRIVAPPSPDNPIIPGDGVGNILLSRTKGMKTRICVVGQFDTDFDGQPDARGQEAIRALALRYGAELVETVDATTSYVVVGLAPQGDQSGASVPPAAPSAAKEDKAAAKEAEAKAVAAGEEEDKEDEDTDKTAEDEGEDEGDKATEEGDESPKTDEGDESAEAGEGDETPEADEAVEEKAEPASEGDKTPADLSALVKKPGEVDPTQAPRLRREMTETERYYEAIRRAEMFAIPRLRQDQFLSFVGIEVGADATKRLMP